MPETAEAEYFDLKRNLAIFTSVFIGSRFCVGVNLKFLEISQRAGVVVLTLALLNALS